jgi:uncharacterized protein (DUF433 family)
MPSPVDASVYFGATSRSAGAFLAMRSLLLRAGSDAAAIRPSAPIAEAARRYPHVFLDPICRLAPGRLPTVPVRTPLYSLAVTTFLVGLSSPWCSLAVILRPPSRRRWPPDLDSQAPGSRPGSSSLPKSRWRHRHLSRPCHDHCRRADWPVPAPEGSAEVPWLTRITRDPAVMGGKPCIRGTRVRSALWSGSWPRDAPETRSPANVPTAKPRTLAEALSYAA